LAKIGHGCHGDGSNRLMLPIVDTPPAEAKERCYALLWSVASHLRRVA